MFKIFASEFHTMGMRRQMQACIDEFLDMVTEGAVHGVYKVVTRVSFGVTWRHKARGGTWMFYHCVTWSHTNFRTAVEGLGHFVKCL